ncbi:hypothetical protein CPB85DRAFT_1447514 [Mucidula mucida]|nr:hypothetical protein CPB85DRAFT_1447514 [Mucidula mucida]
MSTNAEKLGMSEAEMINALGAYFNSTVIEALAYGLYAIVFSGLNMTVTFGYAAGTPDLSKANRVNWNIVYYSVATTTNILITSMIIFCILSVGGIENARTYSGLIQILVQSALLYSVTYITYLGVYAREHPRRRRRENRRNSAQV